jgi:hypothetical protein
MHKNKNKAFPIFYFIFGLILFMPSLSYADCDLGWGNGTRPVGTVVFNTNCDVMQVCQSDNQWHALGPFTPGCGTIPDPCAGSPSPGDVCADGSVYAGLSPDGNVKMFTTPADQGGIPWNNGNTSDYVITSQTSQTMGEANTNNLIMIDSDSGVGGTQPHQAAQACADLTDHGQTDWYLPAQDELNVLYTNKAAIGGFNIGGGFPAGYYWSSSESSDVNVKSQRFSSGIPNLGTKQGGRSVRCVRR